MPRWNSIVILLAVFISVVVFRRFFFGGLLPIPADIITAGYYPWADSVWGYPVKVPIKNTLPSDVVSLLYPWRIQALEIVKSGHFPLWDNSILLGVPLFANFQAALLNPINIIFAVLPAKLAWSWQVVLQLPLLFLATFAYLRNLRLSLSASVLGALSFALSGQVLVWLEYNSLVYTLIYFPLALMIVDKIVARPRLILDFLLGLILALQMFSGYPLNTLYTLCFLILYFLFRERRISRKFIFLVVSILTALGLSAVQLIPGYELSSLSIRSFDVSARAGDIKYLPFAHVLSFFAPDIFGNPGTGNYWSLGSYDNFAFFIPVAGAYFFLLSLAARLFLRKENLIFFLFCLLSLLWALATPFSKPFENVNFIGLDAAVNTRVLFVFSFGASVLAAVAFEETLKNKIKLFYKILPLTVFFALGLAFFVAYMESQRLQREIEGLITANISSSAFFQDAAYDALDAARAAISSFRIGLRNLVLPSFLAIATFVLVVLNVKRINMLFVPLLALAVLPTFDKYLSFTKADLVYPQMPALTQLLKLTGQHRFEREKAEILPANTWSFYGLSSASGQDAFAPLSTVRYLDLINNGKQDDRLLTRFVHVAGTKFPLFDTLDIETVAYLDRHEKESIPYKDGRPFPWIMPEDFVEIANIDTVRVYKNTNNLGRAWFAKSFVCEQGLEETVRILVAADYSPKEKVVIDCPKGETEKPVLDVSNSGKVDQVAREPNNVSFKTNSQQNNYLVVSQAYYPGWKAWVDGVLTPVQKANIGLSAIYLPAGQHELELKYDPDSVKLGAVVSLLTLAFWCLLFGIRMIVRSKKSLA